jgi:hypothetical protein
MMAEYVISPSGKIKKAKKQPAWTELKEKTPSEYALVFLKSKNGNIKTGWLTPFGWDGLHIKKNEEFISWRKKYRCIEVR